MVKNKIRKSLFEQGHHLSKEFILNSNKTIQLKALDILDISNIENVLLYSPFRKEIELNIILKELIKTKKNIYLPKVLSDKHMGFNLLEKTSYMKKNIYGINESDSDKYLNVYGFDLMIIPFVGVDLNGLRLGYGSGYFDRILENIDSFNKRPLLVGLGYEFQVSKEVYGEMHDLKYDIVITEDDIHRYRKSIK